MGIDIELYLKNLWGYEDQFFLRRLSSNKFVLFVLFVLTINLLPILR